MAKVRQLSLFKEQTIRKAAAVSAPGFSIPLSVAEYFAGIGLVRMGLQEGGYWRVVFANDYSHRKYEMYKGFFPDAGEHYVVEDIFNIDPDTVPRTTLATCSFPCIDLSLAGNMGGIHGHHSSAFWGFTRILESQGDSAPPLLLIENVPGWLSSNGGEDFRLTVKALNDLGYACDVFILNAMRFTPQSRPRVFLIGSKHQECDSGIYQILNRSPALLTERLREAIIDNRDLHWMYLSFPEPPKLRTDGLSKEIIEEMAESDSRWWSEDEVIRHLQMMDDSHPHRVDNLAQQDTLSYRTFYRRRRYGRQRAEVRQRRCRRMSSYSRWWKRKAVSDRHRKRQNQDAYIDASRVRPPARGAGQLFDQCWR